MKHISKALFAFTVLSASGLSVAIADTNAPQQAVASQAEKPQGPRVGLDESSLGIQKKSETAASRALHVLDQSVPVGTPSSAETGLGIVWHYSARLKDTSTQDKN